MRDARRSGLVGFAAILAALVSHAGEAAAQGVTFDGRVGGPERAVIAFGDTAALPLSTGEQKAELRVEREDGGAVAWAIAKLPQRDPFVTLTDRKAREIERYRICIVEKTCRIVPVRWVR